MGYRYRTTGDSFKKFNCHNCGKKVTKRTSTAINTVEDGCRTGSTGEARLWLSKDRGKREVTKKLASPRVCKGGCKKSDT